MSNIDCNSCDELREKSANFVQNGITEAICRSLTQNTGFIPANRHTDAQDLHDANDCLVGRMVQDVEAYDVCDWKEFMKNYISNEYEVNKGIICALGGVWSMVQSLINALGGRDGTIPVVRRYRVTVPAERFGKIWKADVGSQNYLPADQGTDWYSVNEGIIEWFAGSSGEEHWVRVPISTMDSVTGVWTQTWVVPSGNPYDGQGKPYVQTVNVQEWKQEGDHIDINFDTMIICPQKDANPSGNRGGPYPVTVDFLIIGEKQLF